MIIRTITRSLILPIIGSILIILLSDSDGVGVISRAPVAFAACFVLLFIINYILLLLIKNPKTVKAKK